MTASDPMIGAHMSIAGGLHRAVDHARKHRCRALQIFTRNNNQWAIKPLTPEQIEAWRSALADYPLETLVHDSYLINLASPDKALFRKSIESFLEEARRCVALGIPRLVFHPGSHVGSGEAAGLRRIISALDQVDAALGTAPVRLLLENTAGQGTNLGWRLEHLAEIITGVRNPDRLAVCIDTCHLLAAGYDFRTPEGYARVFGEIDSLIGVGRIDGFHLNDSKKDLGSRVDRHENIGRGFVGNSAFRCLLADKRFINIPKVLETPKANDMDRTNLALLRRLATLGAP